MSNQLVKKNPAEGYQNVFPKTFIDAIKDKESGVSLQEILQGFNMYFLSYNGSRALTRCKVPSVLRKEGLWITYVLYDHTVVTEWYNSDQIDDNSWSMDSNWRVASNSLVGDVSVSADGYWVINGEKTEAKAQGEQGVTPLLRIGANNKLQVSYNAGKAWKDISDYIVPRFRYTRGTTNNTAGIIQISMDLGKTWTNLSNEITNNLRISRYIGINESLPTSGIAEGTVYMKGPYYDEGDTSNANPIYRMWVYAWKGDTLAWQDNGEFTSISAGVVQEKGNSTTEVMSQKAVTNELNKIHHTEFVESCPYIVELYINEKGRELDVSTVHLTYSEDHFIRFTNTAQDTFTARTKLNESNFYNGIIEIVSETGGINCGYILVDWTQMQEGKTVVKPILEPAYNIDYSPSIKVMLDDRVTLRDTFAKDCPYIKELYINKAGKEAGLATLHNILSYPKITFSNESNDAFIGATATFNSVEEASGIIPIYKYQDASVIYGYMIVDWDNIVFGSPLTKLNDASFNIDYSPSIKGMESNKKDRIYYGDVKPLELCTNSVNNSERIWFQFPKAEKPSYIDTINWIACPGLVGFTKVTYDKEENKVIDHKLIFTSQNTEDENGKIKTFTVDEYLDENQYIGITGAFRFLNDSENKYGFISQNFNIADKSLGYEGEQILGFEALDSNSIEGRIINSEFTINSMSSVTTTGDKKPLELCTQSVSNTGSIWFQYPIKRTGKIDTINFLAKTGVTNFYVVTHDSKSNFIDYKLITSVTNSEFENNNIKTIKVDVELNNNQFIGINGDFRFKSGSVGYYSKYFKLEDSSISGIGEQLLGFEALNLASAENQIQVLKDYLYKPSKWAVLHKDRLTKSKDYIRGTQTFGNFGLIVNGLIVINKYYSLSQRYAKFVCKFGNTTVARFGTTLSNSWNTYFDIDIANKTVRCRTLESKTSHLLRAGDVISITICKNYNVQSCEICNMTLGKREVFEWQFNGQGGVGTGAIGTKVDTGMQYDYYGVTLISGTQYEIQDLIIGSAKCDLVIYGDSITEGEAYYPANMLNTHWVQLIIDKLKGNAVASGRSGTAMSALMERIVNEIPFIKPKYVMVTIGTNGGNTVSGLSNMVEYIQSQGAECILNHIPANINSGGVSNHINTNNVIDEVRAKYSLKGADFDIATSINRNPSEGVNQDMMWKEDYGGSTGTVYHHPNDVGSTAMLEQINIDIPFIFEV